MTLLGGRYQLEATAGEGGSSRALVMTDRWDGDRRVLVKVLRDGVEDADLAREFALLFRVRHPHVARALALGRLAAPWPEGSLAAGAPFFAQELCPGTPADALAGHASRETVVVVAAQLAAALAALHAVGLSHGDVKPANVVVEGADPATVHARLVDFGLAHEGGRSTGGTLGYLAPEALAGRGGPAADVFALGATLVHLFTGTAPRHGAPLVSPVLASFVASLTAREPAARPSAAAAFDALEAEAPPGARDRLAALRDGSWVGSGLFGRAEAVAAIDSALARPLRSTRVLRVRGPAGMGRTAVLEEAVVRGAWRGLVAPGGVRSGRSGGLEAVSGALRELGLEPPAAIPAREPPGARWRRFAELADALAAAAPAAPPLLAFDDVPPGSALDELAGFLERLGERGPRLVWVQSTLADAASATLAPLDLRATRELVAAARPLRPGDADAVAALASASAGVPARLVELLRAHPGAALLRAAHAGELGRGTGVDVATALRDAGEDGGRLAVMVALVREPLPLATARRLVGGALGSALVAADSAGLVVSRAAPGGPTVALAGEGLREPLAARAEPRMVAALAALLESEAPRRAADLGRLWRRLGEPARARPALLAGARSAAASLAAGEALALYDLYLDDPELGAADRAEALVESARVCSALGRFGEARERFRGADGHPDRRLGEAGALLALGRFGEALDLLTAAGAPPGEDAAAVSALAARAALLAGSHDRAAVLAREGLAREPRPATRAELEATLGLAAFYRGDIAAARATLVAALTRAREGDDARVLDACRANLALVLQKALDWTGAEALYRESLESARATRDLAAEAQRLGNLASLEQERGRLGEALVAYEKAHQLARLVDDRRSLVRVGLNRANLCAFLGEVDRALDLAGEAALGAEALGMPSERASLSLLEAELRLCRGERDRAVACLAAARDAFGRLRSRAQLAECVAVESEIALHARDSGRARELGLAAAAEAAGAGRPRLEAQALGWAALASGDGPADEARAVASRLARSAEALRDPDLGWLAHAVLARAATRAGRGVDAELHLAKARQLAAEMRSRVGPRFESSYADVWFRREPWAAVASPVAGVPGLRDLDRLLAINRDLAQDHDPEHLLERIIDAAISLSGAERGFVVLVDGDAGPGSVVVRAARNIDRSSLEGGDLDISRSIALEVVRSGVPISTTDAQGDERFRSNLSVHRLALRSVLSLPLRAREGVLGALYLDHRHRVDAFSDADVALLTAFGDQAAIALANARTVSELAARGLELERSRREIEELNALLARELEARAAELEHARAASPAAASETGRHGMVGASAAMREIYRVVDRVGDKDVSVTIAGESGTGKELVARAIHAAGPRRAGPFVSVNCAAIPRALLESELFGHERGAFTGAVRAKPGLFEVARGGTLLLDEIGEMPLEMQVKLLRVLQQKEVRRLGATTDTPVDVRVVSASNRDLGALVRDGRFREDLWYRLDVVEIHVPPLRERRDDVPLLVEHFLRRHGGEPPPRLARDAMAALLDHDWPGNVRELENELQRAIALADGVITADDLRDELRRRPGPHGADGTLQEALDARERELLTAALARHAGRVAAAARELGLTRAGLYKKLHRHGLVVTRK